MSILYTLVFFFGFATVSRQLSRAPGLDVDRLSGIGGDSLAAPAQRAQTITTVRYGIRVLSGARPVPIIVLSAEVFAQASGIG